MKERIHTRDVLLAMLAGFTYMCSNMMTTPIFTGYVGTLGASGFWMDAIWWIPAGPPYRQAGKRKQNEE